jgi:hypothetical protein
MKKIFLNIFLIVSVAFSFTACLENDDLMTGEVKTGGLVTPVTVNVPYKLGATTNIKIDIVVPVGPAIEKVELYKSFTNSAGKTSNIAKLGELNVGGANTSAEFAGNVTVNYASLISGLTVGGAALPANETLLNIGESWTISYVATMTADSRKVENGSTTNIGVANAYAGNYLCTGTFTHPTAGQRPINEDKYLVPLTAYSCKIPVGDLGGAGYFVDITVDPVTNNVSYSNGTPTEIIASAARSYFDPVSGKFYLNYYYVGGNGNRVIEEVYTPK